MYTRSLLTQGVIDAAGKEIASQFRSNGDSNKLSINLFNSVKYNVVVLNVGYTF